MIKIGQSDGTGNLHRMALHLRGGGKDYWYYFRVNPQNYKETFPQRTTVFKTRTANIVEDFGQGVPTIEMSGTTGFKKDVHGDKGAQRMVLLSSLLDEYATSGYNTEETDVVHRELFLYNFTDNKSYRVSLAPDGYSIDRSVERPLLFYYKITFYVISDASTPDYRQVSEPTIGNGYRTTSDTVNPNDIKPQASTTTQNIGNIIGGGTGAFGGGTNGGTRGATNTGGGTR